MQIEITPETAKAILLIEDRYYFDLFKNIREYQEQEYQFRDAIITIASEIKQQEVKRWALTKTTSCTFGWGGIRWV